MQLEIEKDGIKIRATFRFVPWRRFFFEKKNLSNFHTLTKETHSTRRFFPLSLSIIADKILDTLYRWIKKKKKEEKNGHLDRWSRSIANNIGFGSQTIGSKIGKFLIDKRRRFEWKKLSVIRNGFDQWAARKRADRRYRRAITTR